MASRQDVAISRDRIIAFCQRCPIRKLALFGTVLREDFRSGSDIDVLVEFIPGSGITYLDMVTMQDELAAMLGRSVDLVTPGTLSTYSRQHVLDTAETIYERE
jgi:predicted nucleotidyltransferase